MNAAFQDGPDFYDAEGNLLASFPQLVRGDFDLEGAVAARREFRERFPNYKLESGV